MDETPPGRSWAPPGTAAADGVPPPPPPGPPPPPPQAPGAARPVTATTATVGAVGVTGAAPAAGVPAVSLRPMTVADVLDGGFAVLKARPRRVLGFAAAFVVPVHLLVAFLQSGAAESYGGVLELWSADPTVREENESAGVLFTSAGIAGLLLGGLALVCIAAGLAHLVTAWSAGRDPSGREMAAAVGRRWWALLASFVVVHLVEGASALACGVPLLFVMPLFVAVAPVVGAEGSGPMDAVSRSVRLVRARYWPTLGTALLIGLVAGVLGFALAALPQALASLVGAEAGWAISSFGSMLAAIVITPFVAAATVLLYLDLRVRAEGLDLELDAIDVFDRAG